MPSEYDIFRLTPDPFASVKVERLKQQGYEDQPDIRSLNREQFNTFGYCPDPLNKKLYLAAHVHCSDVKTAFLNLDCPPNFKIWFDDNCIFINYRDTGFQQRPLLITPGDHLFSLSNSTLLPRKIFFRFYNCLKLTQKRIPSLFQKANSPQLVKENPFTVLNLDTYQFMYLLTGETDLDTTYFLCVYDTYDEEIFRGSF